MKRLFPVIVALTCVFSFVANAQTSNCKPFDFNLPTNYQSGPNASSLVSADINGDGKIDVITPNYNDNTVSVLFGDGAGGFFPPQSFPTETGVTTLARGDLNRDGRLDLVGASVTSNKLVVLLNNGQGGFSAPAVTTLPSNIYQFYNLKIADFNGDANPDVAGVTETNLNIFLGNGQGGLALNTTFTWNGDGAEIVTGNFNNDSLADFAVTGGDFGDPFEFGVVLGNSSGSFVLNNRYSLPNEPSGITAGDFNGDGLTDVVIASNYPYQNNTPQTYYLQLWSGNGTGSFTAGTKINFPFFIGGATAGDFNADGKLDLATNLGSMIATVYGAGNGTFQNPTYWTGAYANLLISADVNQDNRQDLLTLQSGSPNSLVSVLLSQGSSGFSLSKGVAGGATDIAASDFNNDGLLDMVTANEYDFTYTSEVVIALNDGNKGLLPDRTFATPASFRTLTVGDFNGDGKKDAATAHSNNAKQIAVFLGDGTGNLSAPIKHLTTNGIENALSGDFNGDRKDDLFVVDGNYRGSVLLSNGDGTFSTNPNFSIDSASHLIAPQAGDFNGDGKLDLVVISTGLTIWLGAGNGTFTRGGSSNNPSSFNYGANISVGDLNADGKLDVVLVNSGAATVLTRYFGDGSGGIGSITTQTLEWQSSQMVAADFNSDGAADIALISSSHRGSLAIVPSTAQSPFWEAPIFFSPTGLVGSPGGGFASTIIAADYNADNKIDLGYASRYRSRGIIYNTSGQSPCLSINDMNVTEGDSGITTAGFTVSLSEPSSQIVRFNYSITAQNATMGTDLQNLTGRLEIPAGQTTVTINVPINGDAIDELDETFVVNLFSPLNASLLKKTGVGTIVDNDAEPTLTITDVSQNEPNSFQEFNFRVNLSAPSGKPISFLYATADGTAVSGKDYSTATNTVNIQPGRAFADIWVPVTSDSMHEPDETFFLNLSNPTNVTISDNQGKGTIVNNDPVPTLFFFIGGAAEGDTGLTARTINLQLTNPTYQLVTFSLATGDGTALKGKDYNSSDTTFVIPAEQMSATTSVQIIGDTINEPNETFNLNLYNVSNATVTNAQAQITIIDDESVANDFDRDGKTDIPVFRPSDRNWYVQFSSTGSFSAFQYGLSTDIPVSGDYNNDGRTDYAVWRASTGGWYTPVPNRSQVWGKEGDVPVQGDYDNDGRIDVAVFRPTDKTWYVQLSSNGSFKIVQFGLETDKPVPADYDGDGKTDIAVFRPATGYWYILRSSDEGITSLQFGIETDQLVPADYDGDGRADIAVFRDGNWYYNRSSNNAFTAFKWGIAGDKPVPGNYDGDDKTDFAVYRSGNWYVWLSSTNSMMTKQFGLPDDVPIPFVSNN